MVNVNHDKWEKKTLIIANRATSFHVGLVFTNVNEILRCAYWKRAIDQ